MIFICIYLYIIFIVLRLLYTKTPTFCSSNHIPHSKRGKLSSLSELQNMESYHFPHFVNWKLFIFRVSDFPIWTNISAKPWPNLFNFHFPRYIKWKVYTFWFLKLAERFTFYVLQPQKLTHSGLPKAESFHFPGFKRGKSINFWKYLLKIVAKFGGYWLMKKQSWKISCYIPF